MSFWLPHLASLLISAVACGLLIPVAPRLALVDHPIGRKAHDRVTPVIGGLAVYFGLICSWLLLGNSEVTGAAVGFSIAGASLVLVGAIDDIRDLAWPARVFVQSSAALILCVFGTELVRLSLPGASVPLELGVISTAFTVFAVVGLVNAINMIDGVDGLAGCIVTASLLVMALLAAWMGDWALSWHLVAAVFAIIGFLAFNLRIFGRSRALTFLGNSGSALLGLLVAWAAIELTHAPTSQITPSVAPWLVALPILDCLTLIARRLAGGRSPFSADRMHFHHLLLDRGYSVGKVILVGLLLHLSLAGCGLLLMVLGVSDVGLILGFLAVLGVYSVAVAFVFDGVSGAAHEPMGPKP